MHNVKKTKKQKQKQKKKEKKTNIRPSKANPQKQQKRNCKKKGNEDSLNVVYMSSTIQEIKSYLQHVQIF